MLEGLEACCLGAGAARGWIVLQTTGRRFDLLASLSTSAPSRHRLVGQLPPTSGQYPARRIQDLCPFREAAPAQVYRIGRGALFLEGRALPSPRILENVTLAVERIETEREVESLREKVQRLGKHHRGKPSDRLLPHIESAGRRTEALSSWYRHAAAMLASSHLGSALPVVAERAQELLEVDFAAVLVKEVERVRLWGGESMRKQLGSSFSLRRLGSVGRRVLEDGETFLSSQHNSTFSRLKVFARLGLKSVVAVPMKIDGRVLGALMLGSDSEREFFPEEIDLARLMAYQSALYLENALLVSGADVERVVARAVLESMADGVFTLDWEKRITSFNPAAEAITGWRAEDAIGRTCSQVMRGKYLCPGSSKPAGCDEHCPLVALLADQELMETGLTVEGTIRTAEGEPRYVSSSYAVVADRGDLLGAVVLFRDITEKRAIEQMKSDYAAALSHDLKTPLTAMKGYAVTLLRHGEKLNEETRQEALEVINSEIDRVTRMFDNLLHQARIEAGIQTQAIESIDLHEAVRRVANLHQFSTSKHDIRTKVPAGLLVRGDPDQLDQILNNLVSNAVKYSPEGCHILISAEVQERDALIQVADDGPGIPADQLEYVFERFRRVEARLSRRIQGSGLGLYITRMLVEGMGGEVGVESTEGEGSTFWFRLPLHR